MWSLVLGVIIVLMVLFKLFNPADNIYFPKCPFRELTGYKCPGCGSQRAIHYLLNMDIKSAFRENSMLITSIPYLMIGVVFDFIRNPNEKLLKLRRILFGRNAIIILLIIIVSFWILRNLTN